MEAAALFVAAYTSLLRMVLPRQVYAQVKLPRRFLRSSRSPRVGRSMATPQSFWSKRLTHEPVATVARSS